MAYMMMARVASEKGDDNEKELYFGKLKEEIRELPESYQAGMFHLGMGMDESRHGNYEAARKIFEDGERIFKALVMWSFNWSCGAISVTLNGTEAT